jgi:hypothetical protein
MRRIAIGVLFVSVACKGGDGTNGKGNSAGEGKSGDPTHHVAPLPVLQPGQNGRGRRGDHAHAREAAIA